MVERYCPVLLAPDMMYRVILTLLITSWGCTVHTTSIRRKRRPEGLPSSHLFELSNDEKHLQNPLLE